MVWRSRPVSGARGVDNDRSAAGVQQLAAAVLLARHLLEDVSMRTKETCAPRGYGKVLSTTSGPVYF
jgi:hypothetical protein